MLALEHMHFSDGESATTNDSKMYTHFMYIVNYLVQ